MFKLLGVLETLENIEQEMRKDLWEKEEETHRRRSTSSFELYLQQKKDFTEE